MARIEIRGLPPLPEKHRQRWCTRPGIYSIAKFGGRVARLIRNAQRGCELLAQRVHELQLQNATSSVE